VWLEEGKVRHSLFAALFRSVPSEYLTCGGSMGLGMPGALWKPPLKRLAGFKCM
jgi:hypothetical protein